MLCRTWQTDIRTLTTHRDGWVGPSQTQGSEWLCCSEPVVTENGLWRIFCKAVDPEGKSMTFNLQVRGLSMSTFFLTLSFLP